MMMMKTQVFKGANVFMSRNLVPPEVFDALLDALKLNGAEIFLCCDPSRNGPNDYHVIASPDHEKFEDLRAKGCNLIGPQCVLTCAKESRPLPKQGFICCLAMDGLKVLASGFQLDEKVKIGKLVTAMGGLLHSKASSDVNFVIVKNVLAAKYKWALNIQKKPVVTVNWLYQCWNEHRVVPQEPFRVPPFSGLTICVTRIAADKRKEIEKLILLNGGKYSAELTKSCTHLIADAAEGDKYKVARKWGHIHIVTRKWFDQSIARKVCLNEESYPTQDDCLSSIKGVRARLASQNGQEKGLGGSVSLSSSVAAESYVASVSCAQFGDLDVEATLSQNISSISKEPSVSVKEEGNDQVLTAPPPDEINLHGCVANDSQSEDNDLYLSECRIFLLGFTASEMRRLVNMVRRGGGSRYMLFNDKLTHIIVGSPSEIQKKQARSFAASGVIQVVKTSWLEDCDRERKEIPVHPRHIAYDFILPKDSACTSKGSLAGMASVDRGKNFVVHQTVPFSRTAGNNKAEAGVPSLSEKSMEEKMELSLNGRSSGRAAVGASEQKKSLLSHITDKNKGKQKLQRDSDAQSHQDRKSSVFKEKTFCFSNSFPEDRRAEIMEWVNQGGGEVVNDPVKHSVHFTIECHGVIPKAVESLQTTYVSSHWVRSCLEDGCLLDVGSHILYSPLPCQTPLPGFQSFRLCVSQYEDKDRLLLRNLCFVLGAKFVEKLTRKVTHLVCKFSNGPKYEAACKWRIVLVTSDWVYECVKQNQVVSPEPFSPKEITTQEREAGCYLVSQFPTQFVQMTSGDDPSQLTSQSEDKTNMHCKDGSINDNRNDRLRENGTCSNSHSKKARLVGDGYKENTLPSLTRLSGHASAVNSGDPEVSNTVPDVASVIEDLLEQTSKIQDQNSPGRTSSDNNLFSPTSTSINQDTIESRSVTGLSRHWLNRASRKDDDAPTPEDATARIYNGFSETQTDSQVVGYEEDLTGRQMLIDRVLNRNSLM